MQAVETKSIALYDYSKVLASIYQDAVDNGQNEVQASCDHKVIFLNILSRNLSNALI